MTPALQPQAEKRHIESVPDRCGGRPSIVGHRIRVQDIVLWTEQGQSADEIVAAFPQISLADVHAALAYYFDHQAEIDRQIAEGDAFAAEMKAKHGPGPLGDLG